MILIKNLRNYKSLFKMYNNCKFSNKSLAYFGLGLGGHIKLLQLTTSSIVFGTRTRNSIINLNLTVIELNKISKIIENLGYFRSIIFFVNSILSFRISFLKCFQKYNKHLFLPLKIVSSNFFKLKKIIKIKRTRRNRFLLSKQFRYFRRTGKNLLRKFFISSKWHFGFLSNSKGFFKFVKTLIKEKVKIGKLISKPLSELDLLLDFIPLFPNYVFIGDHRSNYWTVNECNKNFVPNSSIIDNFTSKELYSMFGIPGNSCSIDSTIFFLILVISNYLLGFYKHVFKFVLLKQLRKKNIYFKLKKYTQFKIYHKLIKLKI